MATPSMRVNPGDVLAKKYKVERVLGSGGMGVVVAAMHLDLGQRVAIKLMLKEALVDPSHAERFLREARAAVQLKSVHTAKVLDVGRLKNGEPFMVMEYLEGQDFDIVLRTSGPMQPATAVGLLLQACEALAEAHGLSMVHRDIKLKNIFLTQTIDGRPLVKVLDFGLAKMLGVGGDVSLTATSAVFGSPQYMSPEQMRSAKDVDERSDIWSIGVCLYQLLTGRVPFNAQGVAEICAMVLKDPAPPPSQFAPGLPLDLEAIVMKCLEKDPTLRYQTIPELAFALEPFGTDEGSARRILQVMQAPRSESIPALPMSSGLDHGRTAGAWGGNTASLTPLRWPTITIAAGLVLGGLGLVAARQVMRHGPATASSATTTSDSHVIAATSAPIQLPSSSPAPSTAPVETAVSSASAQPARAAPVTAGAAAHPGASRGGSTKRGGAPPPPTQAPPPKPVRDDPGGRM